MAGIGPQLPHLAKRKRTPDDDGIDDDKQSPGSRRVRHAPSSTFGPVRPAEAKTSYGPTMPPSIGPAPPPTNENEISLDDGSNDGSDSDVGPALPTASTAPTAAPAPRPRRPVMGPSRPPNTDEIALDDDDSDDDVGPALPGTADVSATKASRPVMGPTMPHGPLPQGPRPRRPSVGPSSSSGPKPPAKTDISEPDSDSDSDSDYGPALPGAKGAPGPAAYDDDESDDSYDGPPRPPSGPSAPSGPAQRDAWMLAPPPDGGVAAHAADPTKIRSRKFASGRAANVADSAAGGAAASAIGSLWTETVDQKAQRLADTVLGRAPDPRHHTVSASVPAASSSSNRTAAREKHIQEYTEATRGRSLYDMYQESIQGDSKHDRKRDKTNRKDRRDRDRRDREDKREKGDQKGRSDAEDDPSARAFDREKDMGLAVHINHKQRRDLVNRASDFGGRFSKGSYL